MRKSFLLIILSIFLFTVIFLTFNNQTSAQTENTWCAERTTSGARCLNVPENEVDKRFDSAPTSCENTPFCRLGTCVDSIQGLCAPNVPQKVCQEDGGVWVEGTPDTISQCQLGCCYVGDSVSFTTQTDCTSLSSAYGINTSFRSDIKDRLQCIASSFPQTKGACVFDDGFKRDCRLLTKSECQQQQTSKNVNVEFYEGLLCSAESLGTICGPTSKNPRTTCVEDKDGVYFLDTCGNLANIYDASKINDQEYWTTIKQPEESCNPDSGNAGSATCGNCDYQLGSTCKVYERGNSQTPTQPRFGDFICADLGCEYKGQRYEHGEEWCGDSQGIDENLPGSEYSKLTCFNGEVTTTMCDPFRATQCVEGDIDGFRTAFCPANQWQDCIFIDNKEECEDTSERDCKWLVGETVTIQRDDEGNLKVVDREGKLVPPPPGAKEQIFGREGTSYRGVACVPKYAPGLLFWNSNNTAEKRLREEAAELCSVTSEGCVVKFEKGLVGGWDCKENCECLGKNWAKERNNLCIALGDCGASKNYIGVQGFWKESDLLEITKDWKGE